MKNGKGLLFSVLCLTLVGIMSMSAIIFNNTFASNFVSEDIPHVWSVNYIAEDIPHVWRSLRV